ncbi:MAG TPA: Holliday junction branch migration protein RuvA [Kofleriaceae bacterium]
MLAGRLVRDQERVIVDCNGVGYEVKVSEYTKAALPSDGERVQLRVFTQVRETEIALYGFVDIEERQLFDLLITVKNVGPSTASAILSGAPPRDLAQLIANENVAGLTRIKGIGKKTAELIIVELHEKCEELLLSWNATGGVRAVAQPARVKPAVHALLTEVMSALVNLGWRPQEAELAVAELSVEGQTLETLLRQALRSMPR